MYHSNFHADRVSVEYVDQLAQRRSNFHADRVSVECVDQLAQRCSDYHADCVSVDWSKILDLLKWTGLFIDIFCKFFLNLSWCRQTVSPSSTSSTSLPSAATTATLRREHWRPWREGEEVWKPACNGSNRHRISNGRKRFCGNNASIRILTHVNVLDCCHYTCCDICSIMLSVFYV